MKNSKRRGLPLRRKQEGRTNYHTRLNLLKAGKPRLVIRRSTHHVLIQAVTYEQNGDKVWFTTTSKDLMKKHKIQGSGKNISVAYLTGIAAGKKVQELKIGEVIADLGNRKPHPTGAVFAALKGVIDAGVSIPHETGEATVFPSEERILGNHLKNKFDVANIKAGLLK